MWLFVLVELLLFFIAGCFAGLMSGLLGIGGGMVVVPALSLIFEHNHVVPEHLIMHIASGTSLCAMIFTSQFSLWGHYRYGDILWSLYQRLVLFICAGTAIGAMLADRVPTGQIRLIFGLFLVLVATQTLLSKPSLKTRFRPPTWLNRLVGTLTGIISGFLGIGGGTIMIPYLSRAKVPMRKIAAISSLTSLTVALIGTLTVIATGFHDNYAPYSTGYIYWPAVLLIAIPSMFFARLGAKLAYKIRLRRLRAFFIVFLFVTGIRMIL